MARVKTPIVTRNVTCSRWQQFFSSQFGSTIFSSKISPFFLPRDGKEILIEKRLKSNSCGIKNFAFTNETVRIWRIDSCWAFECVQINAELAELVSYNYITTAKTGHEPRRKVRVVAPFLSHNFILFEKEKGNILIVSSHFPNRPLSFRGDLI